MAYFQSNMNALKKYHFDLAGQIVYPGRDTEVLDISLLDTRDEAKALVICKNGQQYRLNSAMYPTAEAARWAKQYEEDAENIEVVSIFGLGNGLILRELMRKVSGKTVITVYEPSEVLFCFVMENYDISDILSDSRLNIVIEPLDRILFKEILTKTLDYFNMKKHRVCCHPQYDKVFPESCDRFFNEITACEERIVVNKNTLSRFSTLIVENTLKNLPVMEYINSVSQLGEIIPRDIPVIIVSAGPSLDRNIRLLKEAKGKSVIICVDTAIKYMLRENLEPDLTIVIEPEKPYEHYSDERSHKIPMICDIEANPEIVLAHTGRKILFCVRGYIKQLLNECGIFESDIGSGGSVATAAFALCYQLGFEKVIMIGQDLAYTGENTHAGGVVSEGINHEIGQTYVEDINGGQVRTRGDWIAYLKWFENALSVIKDTDKNMKVIDATEGGAMIHGAEVMTFRQAIDDYCTKEYDLKENLEKLPPMLDEDKYRIFKGYVRKCGGQLDEIIIQAEAGIEACSRILGLSDDVLQKEGMLKKDGSDMPAKQREVYERDRRTVAAINKFCESCAVYQLINNYAVAGVADEMEQLGRNGPAGYYEQTKLAYGEIVRACHEIKEKYSFEI